MLTLPTKLFATLAMTMLMPAQFPAQEKSMAPDDKCKKTAEHRLAEYGLSMSDMRNVVWVPKQAGPRFGDTVLGYNMWANPKSCEKGDLIMDFGRFCYIQQVYTRDGCRIKGIPSY